MHKRNVYKVEYITLAQAARLAPGRPSSNCIWRWCRKGVLARNGQRVHLKHVRFGGRVYTTAEWVFQFGRELASFDIKYFSSQGSGKSGEIKVPKKRTEKQRLADIEKAEQELLEMGVLP